MVIALKHLKHCQRYGDNMLPGFITFEPESKCSWMQRNTLYPHVHNVLKMYCQLEGNNYSLLRCARHHPYMTSRSSEEQLMLHLSV
jgi:hypothetical protein